MLDVEQFVYTAASIDGQKGYQVVAKSAGITNNIIKQLEDYFYPMDVDPTKFKESRSLIILDNNQIVYSRIKNVGIGYDGRDNTLYNHSFVVSIKNFEKYEFDCRIFDKFYLEDQSIRDSLPTLSIDPPIPTFPLVLSSESILHEILFSLFSNKKIALFFDETELPQKILALLPLSMKITSFSTNVIDAEKQPKYDFIMGQNLKRSNLDKNFEMIDENTFPIHNETNFDKSVSYYVQLILSKNYAELQKINTSFDELSSNSNKNKLILLCNYSQFEHAEEEKKSEFAEIVLKILREFDGDTFSNYFKKIKMSIKDHPIGIKDEDSNSILNPYAAFIQLCFVLPHRMMADVFNAVVGSKVDDD